MAEVVGTKIVSSWTALDWMWEQCVSAWGLLVGKAKSGGNRLDEG